MKVRWLVVSKEEDVFESCIKSCKVRDKRRWHSAAHRDLSRATSQFTFLVPMMLLRHLAYLLPGLRLNSSPTSPSNTHPAIRTFSIKAFILLLLILNGSSCHLISSHQSAPFYSPSPYRTNPPQTTSNCYSTRFHSPGRIPSSLASRSKILM